MPIQFVADAIGTVALCPYCRKETELTLGAPPRESAIPGRAIVWSIIALLILIIGVGGILIAFKRAKSLAEERHSPPAPSQQLR